MIDRNTLEALLSRLQHRPAEELETEQIRFAPWLEDRTEFLSVLLPMVTSLANRSGGTLVIGVARGLAGEAALVGCDTLDLEELRRDIYGGTSPGIIVAATDFQFAERNFVVLDVPQGLPPHAVRREFAALDPLARVLDLGEDAVDPLEVERLRNVLRARPSGSSLAQASNGELLRALGIVTGARNRLTLAGLLIVGREEVLRAQLPGHEAIFLHMNGETSYDRRKDYHQPLLAVLEDLAQQIEPYNRIFALKVGLFQFEIPDFPAEVYREALLNAFMHRDYASLSPVYVRLYPDRLEISNPGGFVGGITPDNIIGHEPVTRNRLLAEMLQKSSLVERSGMGIRRMFTLQLAYGKEPPVYVATSDDVRVILRSGKTDEGFARFIARRQHQGQELGLGELVILSYLKRNQEIDLHEAVRILQRGENEAHERLSLMVEQGLLEPFGQKKGRVYRLSKAVYVELRQSVEYHLHRDAETAFAQAAVLNFIRQHGFITNKMVRTLLRVNRSQSSYLLQRMVQASKLVLVGRGKATRYTLPGEGLKHPQVSD